MNINEIRIGQTVYYLKDDDDNIKEFEVKGIIEGATDWKICSVATDNQTTYTPLKFCYRDIRSAKIGYINSLKDKLLDLLGQKMEIENKAKALDLLIDKLKEELI